MMARAFLRISLGLAFALFAFSLAACYQVERDDVSLPNSITVGSMTVSYPHGLDNVKETSITAYLPDGMECGNEMLIANDEYSLNVVVGEVHDASGLGIDAVDEYWKNMLASSLDTEDSDAFDQQFPGLQALAQETVVQGPTYIDLNGSRALVVDLTIQQKVRQMIYYIESNGHVVGYIHGTFSQAKYQAEPAYYDSIFASIKVE